MVVVVLTGIGVVYTGDETVGVDPFVVYRIVAPEVAQLMATLMLVSTAMVPAAGLNVGVATLAAVTIKIGVIEFVRPLASASCPEVLSPQPHKEPSSFS